jgi:hypothetical protein
MSQHFGLIVVGLIAMANSHAASGDGNVVSFTANQTDMADGNIDLQVYVAPRP